MLPGGRPSCGPWSGKPRTAIVHNVEIDVNIERLAAVERLVAFERLTGNGRSTGTADLERTIYRW
jgi:hypothetical protein